MMKNRFFFLNTYDNLSGTILSSILNQHPDVNCETSYPDPFLSNKVLHELDDSTAPVDVFIDLNTSPTTLFSGNSQRYSAFELQNNALIQRTRQAFNAATIVLAPELRIQFLLHSWIQTSLTPGHALKFIEQVIDQDPTSQLMKFYAFKDFYFLVNKELQHALPALSSQDKLFALALARLLAQDTADLPVPRKQFSFEKILDSDAEVIALFKFVTNEKITLTPAFTQQIQSIRKQQLQQLAALELSPLTALQISLIEKFTNQKLQTIYSPHLNFPLSYFYAKAGYGFAQLTESNTKYSKIISIQLNSNRPAQIVAYFDNIEATADNPADVEVLINIDIGDQNMKNVLDAEIPNRKFTLKYVETARPKSFCDLWEPINKLLDITDPGAYFLVNISDEMLFVTPGWDTILKKYVGFFPDDIFRLRASRNRFRNYFDRWECSFAQDAIPITTKKWIDIGGDWNPCFGPDSFQQLIGFYLAREGRFSNAQYLREAPLSEIKFAGDVPALGIDPEKAWRHNRDHIKAMLICQSPAMQLEARRRAMLIKANIIAAADQLKDFYIKDNKFRKYLSLHNGETNEIIHQLDYKVNSLAIFITNQWRKLAFFSYFGDGRSHKKHLLHSFVQYLKARHYLAHVFFQKAYRSGSKVLALMRKMRQAHYYNPRIAALKIKQRLTRRAPLSVMQENERLKHLYKLVCIENQKLTDMNTQIFFNTKKPLPQNEISNSAIES